MPQSQTRPRTKRSPDLTAVNAGSAVSRHGAGGGRIIRTATPETANEAASTANATPVPDGHEHAAHRRPGETESDGPHELVERVRGGQIGRREKIGNDGVERRHEERARSAVDGHDRHELPEPERAGERERPRERRQRPPGRRLR